MRERERERERVVMFEKLVFCLSLSLSLSLSLARLLSFSLTRSFCVWSLHQHRVIRQFYLHLFSPRSRVQLSLSLSASSIGLHRNLIRRASDANRVEKTFEQQLEHPPFKRWVLPWGGSLFIV